MTTPITRRLLGDMLMEIATGTLDAVASAPGVRVRRIEVTLPIELGLRPSSNGHDVLGDLPRAVTRTAFDVKPSRLMVVWEEGEAS